MDGDVREVVALQRVLVHSIRGIYNYTSSGVDFGHQEVLTLQNSELMSDLRNILCKGKSSVICCNQQAIQVFWNTSLSSNDLRSRPTCSGVAWGEGIAFTHKGGPSLGAGVGQPPVVWVHLGIVPIAVVHWVREQDDSSSAISRGQPHLRSRYLTAILHVNEFKICSDRTPPPLSLRNILPCFDTDNWIIHHWPADLVSTEYFAVSSYEDPPCDIDAFIVDQPLEVLQSAIVHIHQLRLERQTTASDGVRKRPCLNIR